MLQTLVNALKTPELRKKILYTAFIILIFRIGAAISVPFTNAAQGIIDDTTSAVDMETEHHIQESLRNLDFPCTKIIIAQRISSVADADMIIVLDEGCINDIGTHEELMASGGEYAEMFSLQASRYLGEEVSEDE